MTRSAQPRGQLQLDFKPRGTSMVTAEKYSELSSKRNLDNHLLVMSAHKWQDLERLKKQLKKGANPNHRVKYHADGAPALHQWALTAHVEAVQLLLDHGACVDILDDLGRSALKYATGALNWAETPGAEQVVRLIIEAGADVNLRSTLGYTPLMWAARAGNLEITKLLIEKGVNAHEKDNDGNDALHQAQNPGHKHASTVQQERQATIKLLRSHGGRIAEAT